jgi:PAS domain S-box-containing protein
VYQYNVYEHEMGIAKLDRKSNTHFRLIMLYFVCSIGALGYLALFAAWADVTFVLKAVFAVLFLGGLAAFGRVLYQGGLENLKRPVKHGKETGVASQDIILNPGQQKLYEQARLISEMQRIAHIGSWRFDLETDELIWSKEIYNIFEIERKSRGGSYAAFLDRIHPEDRDYADHAYKDSLKTKLPFDIVYRVLMRDGRIKFVREQCESVFGTDGTPLALIGTVQDITEIKLAQKTIREGEERLQHAQKMEAIGQLTGGVAHDFNNLLAVIQGNISLLEADLNNGRQTSKSELRRCTDQTLAAARRGANLTHRLLAFSGHQPFQPEAISFNHVVKGMETLLVRTLGENINLNFHLVAKNWLADADASQLENALLNLSINARDAMVGGGQLTIETGEVVLDEDCTVPDPAAHRGEYVMLAVSDTGTGMDESVLEKAFEPFFTTKRPGRGTGLGLSMVYGFAKQSGGHAAICSEHGEGTTVRIYLPRSAATRVARRQAESRPAALIGGGEKILVIEDDPAVRVTTVRILENLKYKVVSAENGEAALCKLAAEGAIDLVLTDVVLTGGLSGLDTASAIKQKLPNSKILYMSGYTENAILHHHRLDIGINLLTKPFTSGELDSKLRHMLKASS